MIESLYKAYIKLQLWILRRLLRIQTIEETISDVVTKHKSISRYGDGEFALMVGQDIGFQKADKILSQRLREILSSDSQGHIVAIGDGVLDTRLHMRTEENAKWNREHNKVQDFSWLKKTRLFKRYGNATITRFWIPFKNKEKAYNNAVNLQRLWENRDVIIIEGAATRIGIGNDLLDKTKSIKRIICPAVNAFDKYNDILDTASKISKKNLILIALGPCATVLAYDLHKLGYQAVDIGHIDLEYEWMKAGCDMPTLIKGKFINELEGGNVVDDCYDKEYQMQIISVIE